MNYHFAFPKSVSEDVGFGLYRKLSKTYGKLSCSWPQEGSSELSTSFYDMDALVLFLPKNSWERSISDFSESQIKLLQHYIKTGKKVFGAYFAKSNDKYSFYNLSFVPDNDTIFLRQGVILNTSTNHGRIINEDSLLKTLSSLLGTEPVQEEKSNDYFDVRALKEKIEQLEATISEMDDYIEGLITDNNKLEQKIRKEYQPIQDSRMMLLI